MIHEYLWLALSAGQIPTVNIPNTTLDSTALSNMLSLIFALAGAVAVIFILIGAVKFTTSSGNPQQISSARNTVIYALVGLGISMISITLVSVIANEAGEAAESANPIFGPEGILTTVAEWLAYAIGAASVIMIIVGAIRYVTSAGQSQSAAEARNTIIYAVIGLVIALAGGFLVAFVLNGLG